MDETEAEFCLCCGAELDETDAGAVLCYLCRADGCRPGRPERLCKIRLRADGMTQARRDQAADKEEATQAAARRQVERLAAAWREDAQ